MNKNEKLEAVKAILKELESSIEDHLEEDGLDIHALDLVKSALEIYETNAKEGEGE